MVVDRFFFWVADATVDQRIAAIGPLVRAALLQGRGEDEREAVEAALTLVAEDDEISVRRALAAALAEEDDAPRYLLLMLLHDDPSVAAIVAARSEGLIDAELVDLVAGSDPVVHRAVASRRRVGPDVAVALSEAGDRASAVALLANPGADVPALALERLVERFGEFSEVREALMSRPHVPITVRHRVLEKLSEAIGNLVVLKAGMKADRAEIVTRDARDKATIALLERAGTAETQVLVEHLRHTGQLTTRLLLRAACVGDLRFVEEALAALSGVPVGRVGALVAEGRESAFRALYRRSSIPERAYPAFAAALETHRELVRETGGWDGRPGDRARFSRRLIERVLTRYSSLERRDGDDLLMLLRRFAADAARDRVRAVMAERIADVRAALTAPAAEETASGATPPEVVPATGASTGEPVVFGRRRTPPDGLRQMGRMDAGAQGEAAPFEPLAEPDDAWGGLFGHVRLEDLPPEWLADDAETVDVFGAQGAPRLREGFGCGAATVGEGDGDVVDARVLDELELSLGAELRGSLTNRAA